MLGRINGRWRLVTAESAPAGSDPDDLLARLVARLTDADPALARQLRLRPSTFAATPQLVARTAELPRLAILATSERERAAVERLAETAGWRSAGLSLEASHPVALARLALERDVAAIILAAGESPALDPKPAVAALATLGAALAGRDPTRPLVLAGLLRTEAGRFAADADGAPPPYGPAATAGDPPGAGLRRLLDAIQPGSGDGRHALVRATDRPGRGPRSAGRAGRDRVDRRHCGSSPGPTASRRRRPSSRRPPWLRPASPTTSLVDGVLAWSSIPLDRHRMRDRLRELRLTPWGEAHGAGAVVRYAAARAALERLVGATPEISGLPAPDLIVVAGGRGPWRPGRRSPWPWPTWSAGPAPASWPGITPDCLARSGWSMTRPSAGCCWPSWPRTSSCPLGTVVTPAGLRAGKSAGRLADPR